MRPVSPTRVRLQPPKARLGLFSFNGAAALPFLNWSFQRQKFLNLVGDNSVDLTVRWMLRV
jgi:hypothetical protein